jgi:hypothetical protein
LPGLHGLDNPAFTYPGCRGEKGLSVKYIRSGEGKEEILPTIHFACIKPQLVYREGSKNPSFDVYVYVILWTAPKTRTKE